MRMKLKIYGIVLLTFAIFIIQNIEIVNVQFLFWHFGLPRSIMLLVTFSLGVILGIFSTYRKAHKAPATPKD